MTARCQVANMSHETSSTAALWALNIVPSSPPGGTLNSLTVTSPPGGTLVTWGLPDVEKNYEKLSRVATLRRGIRSMCPPPEIQFIRPPTPWVWSIHLLGLDNRMLLPGDVQQIAPLPLLLLFVEIISVKSHRGDLPSLKLLRRSSFCQKATG